VLKENKTTLTDLVDSASFVHVHELDAMLENYAQNANSSSSAPLRSDKPAGTHQVVLANKYSVVCDTKVPTMVSLRERLESDRAAGAQVKSLRTLFTATTRLNLTTEALSRDLITASEAEDGKWFDSIDTDRFVEILRDCYPAADAARARVIPLEHQLADIRCNLGEGANIEAVKAYVNKINMIVSNAGAAALSVSEQRAVEILAEGLMKGDDENRNVLKVIPNVNVRLHSWYENAENKPGSIMEY